MKLQCIMQPGRGVVGIYSEYLQACDGRLLRARYVCRSSAIERELLRCRAICIGLPPHVHATHHSTRPALQLVKKVAKCDFQSIDCFPSRFAYLVPSQRTRVSSFDRHFILRGREFLLALSSSTCSCKHRITDFASKSLL